MSADPYAPPVAATPADAGPRVSRLWPSESDTAASARTMLAALAVGLLAALTVRPQLAGSAHLLVGVGILSVAVGARKRPLPVPQVGAALVTVALLVVPVMRSAPWLVALSLLGAGLMGTLALVGGRTWTGLGAGALSGAFAVGRAGRWVRRSVLRLRLPRVRSPRVWVVMGATVGLIAVFGALFSAADPAYASLVKDGVQAVDLLDDLRRLPALAAGTTVALLAGYLSEQPPNADALAPPAGRPVRRWEWLVPLAVLDLLFLSFVLVQLSVLFGGRRHVLATDGLSYADYARQGFWQLLVVTVLTLAVIAVAVRTAPRATTADRLLVRLLLGPLCLLALAIVASALHRLSLYEQQYGFTRLRLFVSAVEFTLGAVFVLLLAAGIQLRGTWLPRGAVALAAVALLALAVVNPDAAVAKADVRRYEHTGRIDVAYLAGLSPDAVPALDRLPADLRSCALRQLAPALRGQTEPWYDVDLARRHARHLVARHPVADCRSGASAPMPHD